MTTELTKAAQQALEACPFCGCDMRIESNRDWHKLHGNHAEGCVFSEDAPVMTVPATDCQLEVLVHDWNTRALTQRPAAQTEREAFEARVVAEAGEGAIAKWLGTDGYENTRVQDYRLGWVWCLEWQARASLPTQPAAQATHEPVKFSHAGHFYNLVAHALMEVKRPDACGHRLRLILDELAALMGQPATPEPVGAREALERIASWNEHPATLGVDYGSNGVRDYYRKIARDALARPAPGVPEGWRDAFDLAAQMLTWGREEGLMPDQIDQVDAHAKLMFSMLAAAQAKGGEHG